MLGTASSFGAYPSYTRPSSPIKSPSLNPYPSYDPILPPPLISPHELPSLPSAPRLQQSLPPTLQTYYSLSTHIVTAAWPRMPCELFDEAFRTGNIPPYGEEDGRAKKLRVEKDRQELERKKMASERRDLAGVPKREEVLYNVFNLYRRVERRSEKGLTLIVAHGIGFVKEVCPRLLVQIESLH